MSMLFGPRCWSATPGLFLAARSTGHPNKRLAMASRRTCQRNDILLVIDGGFPTSSIARQTTTRSPVCKYKEAGELGFEPGFPSLASHRRDTALTLQNH